MSARSASARGLSLLVSRERPLPQGWRRPRPRASPSASPAPRAAGRAEPAPQPLGVSRCRRVLPSSAELPPLGPALPRLCSRPAPAAPCLFVWAALFPVCLSVVWAGVSELPLPLPPPPPPPLLPRRGPELSFSRLACPELVPHRTADRVVCIISKVGLVNEKARLSRGGGRSAEVRASHLSFHTELATVCDGGRVSSPFVGGGFSPARRTRPGELDRPFSAQILNSLFGILPDCPLHWKVRIQSEITSRNSPGA